MSNLVCVRQLLDGELTQPEGNGGRMINYCLNSCIFLFLVLQFISTFLLAAQEKAHR